MKKNSGYQEIGFTACVINTIVNTQKNLVLPELDNWGDLPSKIYERSNYIT